ncbi:MAG TPA: hypothetical protein VMC09_07760 [Anaerolineales bacterium]|nr:hypothetical protein [Anaerolineales bacterium]
MRKFLAVVCAIFFVLTAILALLLFNIDRRLLVPGTYKLALARQQVYARLPRILAEQVVMTMNYNPCAADPLKCENLTPDFKACAKTVLGDQRYTALSGGVEQPSEAELQQLQACIDKYVPDLQSQQNAGNSSSDQSPFKSLSVGDMETVISTLMPPAELKATTESILDQVFAYIDGQQNTLTISLVSLKKRLSGPAGLEAVLKIIRSQPACTDQQLIDMQKVFNSNSGTLILCRPTEDQLTMMTPTIQADIRSAAAQIPDTRTITPAAVANPADFGPLGKGPVGGIRLAHLILRLSPDLPLFFLLLLSFLAVRSPKGWLRWWGIPFFITGIFAAAFGVVSLVFFEQAWLTVLAGRIPPYLSLGTVSLLHDLVRAILQSYLGGILFGGIALLVLGLALWIISAFIKDKVEPIPEPVSLPAAS